MSSTKMSLLVIVFLTCNVALFVHGQVNAELDRPFVTREGAVYRDELTIASSKSVAQFAKSYQRRENGKVNLFTLYMRCLIMHVKIYAILYQWQFPFNWCNYFLRQHITDDIIRWMERVFKRQHLQHLAKVMIPTAMLPPLISDSQVR